MVYRNREVLVLGRPAFESDADSSDILGREMDVSVNEPINECEYFATFGGTNLPPGVYFYEIELNHAAATRSMILTKDAIKKALGMESRFNYLVIIFAVLAGCDLSSPTGSNQSVDEVIRNAPMYSVINTSEKPIAVLVWDLESSVSGDPLPAFSAAYFESRSFDTNELISFEEEWKERRGGDILNFLIYTPCPERRTEFMIRISGEDSIPLVEMLGMSGADLKASVFKVPIDSFCSD
ncbi:MAG: hypothetical protein BMS9Abin05_0977 [Rhodothermia bacterium]|nr:MAG: hypothetical protein BMS9Abin05_0977 [Rhodothermia bacterium]